MAARDKTQPDTLRGTVVVLDDEVSMGRIVVKTLGLHGFDARAFSNPREGLDALREVQPDVLLTDFRMPEMNGLEVIEYMRREWPDVPTLVLTAFGTVEGAVDAMQAGAFNYITKPFEQSNLIAQIARAIEHRRMTLENLRLSEELGGRDRTDTIDGKSSAIELVRDMIRRAAPTDSSVLITGPSGVGKELVARAIHTQSRRQGRRFVAINCPSIPANLIESELFGHERGAFTGADRVKMGLVELAHGGTLFLDEIAELPAETQVKLLRMLQECEIQRVGGLKPIRVDLRVLAATNRDPQTEMRAGRFREDLFFRINVVQIAIPPLCQRAEDVPLLAERILRKVARRMMRPDVKWDDSALEALKAYDWPGNVRELENVIERAVVLSPGELITADELTLAPPRLASPALDETQEMAPIDDEFVSPSTLDYRAARDAFERDYLRALLAHNDGNMTRAAKVSGISRRNLYAKLEKLGLATNGLEKARGNG